MGEEPLSSSLQSPAVTPAAAPTATSAPSLRDTLLAVFGTKVTHVPASGHSASAHHSVLHTCRAPPPLRTHLQRGCCAAAHHPHFELLVAQQDLEHLGLGAQRHNTAGELLWCGLAPACENVWEV